MLKVVITGATSGIGEITAKYFHEQGHYVHLLGRNEHKLSRLSSLLPNSQIHLIDFADRDQINELASLRSISEIDVLINNAGIFEYKSITETSISDWENMLRVNTIAPALLSKWALEKMKVRRKGSIVFISSTLGHRPSAQTAAYSASKAAIHSLVRSTALEAATYNIRVNCIAPGIVETPIHNLELLTETEKMQKISHLNTLQPLRRIGQSIDIAKSVYFLATDASSWTTGAILDVDGGINL